MTQWLRNSMGGGGGGGGIYGWYNANLDQIAAQKEISNNQYLAASQASDKQLQGSLRMADAEENKARMALEGTKLTADIAAKENESSRQNALRQAVIQGKYASQRIKEAQNSPLIQTSLRTADLTNEKNENELAPVREANAWHDTNAPLTQDMFKHYADQGYPIAPQVQTEILSGIANRSASIRKKYGPLYDNYLSSFKGGPPAVAPAAPAQPDNQMVGTGVGY